MINTGGHLMNDQNFDLIYMILDLSAESRDHFL